MHNTMVFITPFWKRLSLHFCLALVLLLGAAMARAGELRIQEAHTRQTDTAYLLDARFKVALNPAQEAALMNGTTLTFQVDYTVTKPRWYWAWRQMADWFEPTSRRALKLSFHALTRQYRLYSDGNMKAYASLPEALDALGQVRDWRVLEKSYLVKSLPFAERAIKLSGQLQMYLALSELPKPVQLDALASDEWKLASEPVEVPLGYVELDN